MDRRQFLAASSALGLGIANTGCIANSSSAQEGNSGDDEEGEDKSRHERMQDVASDAGTEVEYQYQRASVNELIAAETFIDNPGQSGDEGKKERSPPTAGGLWMAVNVSISHMGDQRRPFPAPEEMYLVYEDYDESTQVTPTSPFEIRDERYRTYSSRYVNWNIQSRGAFPGVTVDGWTMFEVPRLYDLEEFVMVVPLGLDGTPHTWTFSEKDLTTVPNRDYDGSSSA